MLPSNAAVTKSIHGSLHFFTINLEMSSIALQVQGKVTGSFQSGYLADVTVNGFTYQAVLFSPYLALNTPQHTFTQPALASRAQSGSHPDDPNPLPGLPDDSAALQQQGHSELQAAKHEDGVPHPQQSQVAGVPGVDYHMPPAAPQGPDLHA